MIKYSIILPYYKRPELGSSLISFQHLYSARSDYEVLIMEDTKNTGEYHDQLMTITARFPSINTRIIKDPLESFAPSHKYNMGVSAANGIFVILSSPEIFHETDILAGLDAEFQKSSSSYVICSCRSAVFDRPIKKFNDYCTGHLNPNYQFCSSWYQHSKYRNVMFHFCSAMSKETYQKVEGFDERYCRGMGFDDNNFLRRIQTRQIPMVLKDELITIHIEHDRDYQKNRERLIELNRWLFDQQSLNNNFY